VRRRNARTWVILAGWLFATWCAEAAEKPAAPTQRPWDYVYSLGGRIRWFFKVRHQLRLVATGDSRASSCDPRAFYADQRPVNKDYPVAFNLFTGAIGFDVQEILLKEYIFHCPKLEWVVYQMSPRLFNRYYHDTGIKQFLASNGLKYDREHAESIWGETATGLFRAEDVPRSSPLLNTRRPQVRYWSPFCRVLIEGANIEKPNPYGRLWRLLPADVQEILRRTRGRSRAPNKEWPTVAQALNAVIERPDFYQENVFAGLALPEEARDLLARKDALSKREVQALNRALLEAMFPEAPPETRRVGLARGRARRDESEGHPHHHQARLARPLPVRRGTLAALPRHPPRPGEAPRQDARVHLPHALRARPGPLH